MTLDERLALLAELTHENTEGIGDLLKTTREHTKQLEIDGQYIKQLAILAAQSIERADKDREYIRERIAELVNMAMNHEPRIKHIEGEPE